MCSQAPRRKKKKKKVDTKDIYDEECEEGSGQIFTSPQIDLQDGECK